MKSDQRISQVSLRNKCKMESFDTSSEASPEQQHFIKFVKKPAVVTRLIAIVRTKLKLNF